MHVPLLFSFWFTVAAYVVHCIDESLLGGSFVEKVRQHWWPEYSWKKFFWFNSAYFVVMIASVLVLAPRMGSKPEEQIFGLAIGVVLAGIAQAFFQLPSLAREGFRYQWVAPWHDPTVREVVR